MAIDELQRQLDAGGFRISNLGTPTTANDATRTDNSTAPQDPAAAAAPGASFLASPMNHVHQGVHSVHSDGEANIFGDVRLVSGTGITLSQSGQDITVAADGGSVNKVTMADDRKAYVVGVTEEIVAEFNMNFDDAGGANVQARLSAIVSASAATGSLRLYVGATSPGATAGGTQRAIVTTTSTSDEKKTNLGASFANPGGEQLVQITAANSAGGNRSNIRGMQIAIG